MKYFSLIVLIIFIFLGIWSVFIEPNILVTKKVIIEDKELAGLKIIFASDFHIKPMEDTTIKNKIEFYIDSAKATRLYELLLTKYSDFKEIKDDEVEIEELNNLDDGDESIQYIYKTAKKKMKKFLPIILLEP